MFAALKQLELKMIVTELVLTLRQSDIYSSNFQGV